MFSEKDIQQIKTHGLNVDTVNIQLEQFRNGFPFLPIQKPAIPNEGIKVLSPIELEALGKDYDTKYATVSRIKFVPASGAATRMFKELFDFFNAFKANPSDARKAINEDKYKIVNRFISDIEQFAFYKDLANAAHKNGLELKSLINAENYVEIIDLVLNEKGLNYGKLPKALIKFHSYNETHRAALEEHLIEGALYAKSNDGNVYLHFTVSEDHMDGFKNYIASIISSYESKYNVKYVISYSIQQSSTDTIASDINNNPFREADGSLLFRPGGHGALLTNLNTLDQDIIIIKNIDNIHHERLIDTTVKYKKALASLLVHYRELIFSYITKLNTDLTSNLVKEVQAFYEHELCTIMPPKYATYSDEEKCKYLLSLLNRPIRICGMVKSDTDTGGGPFWTINPDTSMSLQIAETAQINMNDEATKAIAKKATHFNPVDIACCIKKQDGSKFDLLKYRDPMTGFISKKSKDGKDLKALELPGLWNGSMSNWNTVLVETPYITFNPVKSVVDLLNKEHLQ